MLAQMATSMIEKFNTTAQKAEDYYTTKVLPTGKTVSNYDTLVAAIATKKAAVGSALTKAQADMAAFSCDNGDPKAQMTQFKNDMQAVKQALKEYRQSIKDLIVAIHSVTGTDNGTRPTRPPKPTRTEHEGGNSQ